MFHHVRCFGRHRNVGRTGLALEGGADEAMEELCGSLGLGSTHRHLTEGRNHRQVRSFLPELAGLERGGGGLAGQWGSTWFGGRPGPFGVKRRSSW